jgi:hypothetical protein
MSLCREYKTEEENGHRQNGQYEHLRGGRKDVKGKKKNPTKKKLKG